jgi:hypothetical protein
VLVNEDISDEIKRFQTLRLALCCSSHSSTASSMITQAGSFLSKAANFTGKGDPKWTVESDETAPSKSKVIKQFGRATFPLLLKNESNIKDGFVEVKFKAGAGSQDRAAGIVWRAKDANNYYVVRANALEDNFVLYKTVDGVRTAVCTENPILACRFPKMGNYTVLCAHSFWKESRGNGPIVVLVVLKSILKCCDAKTLSGTTLQTAASEYDRHRSSCRLMQSRHPQRELNRAFPSTARRSLRTSL